MHGIVPRAIRQLRLNRLTSTASYQAFIGQIMSPICPHCGTGKEMAEHLLLSCPRWAAERQLHMGDCIDIKDVFPGYVNLVEFLISSGHLSPHTSTAWWAGHDNNNNNNARLSMIGRPVTVLLQHWSLNLRCYLFLKPIFKFQNYAASSSMDLRACKCFIDTDYQIMFTLLYCTVVSCVQPDHRHVWHQSAEQRNCVESVQQSYHFHQVYVLISHV